MTCLSLFVKGAVVSLMASFLAHAEVQAEGTKIEIGITSFTAPVPQSFSLVPKEATALQAFLRTTVVSQNRLLAYYFPSQTDYLKASTVAPRSFSVQTPKGLEPRTLTLSEFKSAKDELRHINTASTQKFFEKAKTEIRDNWKKELDANVDLSVAGVAMHPPHDESERHMAFSMQFVASVNSPVGGLVRQTNSATATILLLRGKVLYLYANGEAADLEWTRAQSKLWASEWLAANPSDATTLAKESTPPQTGFDVQRVGNSALIGGLIGALIGLARMWQKKRALS